MDQRARRRPSKSLEAVEEALHAVSEVVEGPIERQRHFPARVAGNDRLEALGHNGLDDLVRVVTRVSDEGSAAHVLKQRFCHRNVMLLAGRYLDVEGAALCVGDRVDLRGDAAT
jgi:hypothetical protein